MKLLMVGASPYARKVRVFAAERGLHDSLEIVISNPHVRPPELVAENPLSKVPTLIAEDGTAHIDSLAICLYLDSLGSAPPLVPAGGAERWAVLQRHALGHGVMDCAVFRRVESLLPPEKDRLATMEKHYQTTVRVLDRFEGAMVPEPGKVALDTLTLACALSYIDFRHPGDNWRDNRPRLSAWHAEFARRPSMQSTEFFL